MKSKLGLSLGGGAARGYAHLTDTINQKIYKIVMESEKEPVNFVENIMQFIRKGIIYGKALTSKSMVPDEIFNKVFDTLVPEVNIEDLKIPFCAIVTKRNTGVLPAFYRRGKDLH